MKRIGIFAVMVLVFGCQTISLEQELLASGLQPLTAKEIERVFVDKTVYGATPRGGEIVEYIPPDGSSRYRQGGRVYDGIWSIENDNLCFVYQDARPGKKTCHRVYMRDGLPISVHVEGPNAGNLSGTIAKVSPGNVDGL